MVTASSQAETTLHQGSSEQFTFKAQLKFLFFFFFCCEGSLYVVLAVLDLDRYIAEDGLELSLLPLSGEYWDYWLVPPCPD